MPALPSANLSPCPRLDITREMKAGIGRSLRNWPERDVRFICISDGGALLGLGDIGAQRLGHPIGKLQLYTLAQTVPPSSLLPFLFGPSARQTRPPLRGRSAHISARVLGQTPPSDRRSWTHLRGIRCEAAQKV